MACPGFPPVTVMPGEDIADKRAMIRNINAANSVSHDWSCAGQHRTNRRKTPSMLHLEGPGKTCKSGETAHSDVTRDVPRGRIMGLIESLTMTLTRTVVG